MAKLHELAYELSQPPPYSPGSASINYFLFLNLKKSLSGQKFCHNNEVTAEMNAHFGRLEESYFSVGIEEIKKYWSICIEMKDECVEKLNKFYT